MSRKSPYFDPRFCNYKLSPKIREHVDKLAESDDVDSDTRNRLNKLMDTEESNKNTLSYDNLTELHKYVQRADPDYTSPFYMFMEECKCIEPKERENKKLDDKIKELRLKSSQLIYNRMAQSVDKEIAYKLSSSMDTSNSSTATEFKNLYGSVIAVVNSFLVYICTFLFCYKAFEYCLPEANPAFQVLFGLFGSTIVAIAELYFIFKIV